MHQEEENKESGEKEFKERIFKEQKPYFDEVFISREGFEDYKKTLQKIAGLSDGNMCLGCMDERLMGIGFHAAGSLILKAENPKDPKEINKIAQLLVKKGITKVTSHDGCGAAALSAKKKALILQKQTNTGKIF